MKVINFGNRACENARRYLDAYMNNELMVETSHEVAVHLESCGECAAILAGKRRTRDLVRAAVRAESAPPGLEARIRAQIRANRPSRGWVWLPAAVPAWAAAAAAVVVLAIGVGGGIGVRRSYLAAQAEQENILRVGLKDHIHCALGGHIPAAPRSIEAMAKDMGPEYVELVPVLKEKAEGLELLEGHRCTVKGRRYVHIVFRNVTGKTPEPIGQPGGDTLMSVIITRKQVGESFPRNRLLGIIEASGIPIHYGTMDKLEISGFETRDHMAYVVSNLPREANQRFASTFAQPVRTVLAKMEI